MASDEFFVEKVPGTQSDDYRYLGPEGRFQFELGVDTFGLRSSIRDGHEVRIIDELEIAWANRAFPRPVARAVREPVIERLVAHFASIGVLCDVRLPSGATRDAIGRVRPGYRWQGSRPTCRTA